MMRFELNVSDVSLLLGMLPDAARHLDSGIVYDGQALHAPAEWQLAISDVLRNPDWRTGTAEPAVKLAAYAADLRWQMMMAGVTVLGLQVPGDDTSQTRLSLARAALKAGEITEPLSFTIGLVTASLTLAMVDQLVTALALHTQQAFQRQATAVAGINAGTITTRAQIDTLFA